MNYCDTTALLAMFNGSQQPDDVSETLYTLVCPPLVIGCLISVFLNICLLIIGHFKIHNKSPILLLSLNLASTDTIASLLVGIGFVVNSYLPKVYNISLPPCPMLAFEICRTSALIASVSHLFALAFIHYRGIVRPLHYRGFTFFCTNHMTHSINFITIISWIVPLFTFTLYFSTIPCQGFLSATCSYLFLASKRYRFFLLIFFSIPLLLMLILYIRIFTIITKNQRVRSQLTSHISVDDSKRKKSTDLKLLGKLNDTYRTDDRAYNSLDNRIPKIQLEQKLTLKRSFYSKINFLTRTLSSKSYTLNQEAGKLELNVLKSNDIRDNQLDPTDKLNNNHVQRNYNLTVDARHLSHSDVLSHFECRHQDESFSSKRPKGPLIKIKLDGTRLIRYCDDELIIYNDQRANDKLNDGTGYVLRDNSKHLNDSANEMLFTKDEKQSTDVHLNTANHADCNRPGSGMFNEQSVNQFATQRSIDKLPNRTTSEQLLLNKSKCNYHDSTSCETLNFLNAVGRDGPNEWPEHVCEERPIISSKNDLLDKRTEMKDENKINSLTNSNENSKNSQLHNSATRVPNGSREIKHLNNTRELTSANNLSVSTSPKVDRIVLQNSSSTDLSNDLIKNLSASQLNLDNSCNTRSNLENNKSTEDNFVAGEKQRNRISQTNADQCTSAKLSLNLVKKSSTCSSKSTKSFRSIKSVEIKDDFSISQSDHKSQKDNRIDNSCSTDSPTKTSTSRSQFNYPRKLRNKLNASLHGSRSVRFHTKALFTSLTILGTYLICWGPALIFLGLTCVDDCAYPLFSISIKKRVVISVVTNSLVIIKAITDPFIYIYRIQEVKLAVRQLAIHSSIYKIFFINTKNANQQRKTQTKLTSINAQRGRSLLISKDLSSGKEAASTTNTTVDNLEANTPLDT